MLENKRTEITLFILGFILIGVGVFVWNKGVTPTSIEVVNQTIKQSPIPNKQIFVDVAGEVENPGVYSLVLGARVGEAIASAGGTTVTADIEWISRNLNQAKVLGDGEKVYIPSISSENKSSSYAKASEDKQNSKININSVSESELDKLPGIGPVTAGKIINGRPYANIEELKMKKIVTEKVYEQIKDMISTW